MLFRSEKNKKSPPDNIHMRLTLRCNLQCSMCDIWKQKNLPEMDVKKWKIVVKKIYDWLGPYRVDFAGGEIFLYEDFFKLVEFCKKLDCHTVVTTNGILLDKRKLEKIIESGLDTINISLDTLSPEKYKSLRNVKCLRKVIKACQYLKKHRKSKNHPYLCIATIIMEQNSDELLDLIYWVEENNADIINFQVIDNNFGKEYYPQWYKSNIFWPKNSKNIKKKIDEIIQLKEKDFPINNSVSQLMLFKSYFNDPGKFIKNNICRSGDRNFIVDINGEVLLCWNMAPVGNIFQQSPKEIWNSEVSSKLRKKIVNCNKTCKILNCNFQ